MTCWCRDINYICLDCEKKEAWFSRPSRDKIKLLTYKKILNRFDCENKAHLALLEYLNKNNLCISEIPLGDRLL